MCLLAIQDGEILSKIALTPSFHFCTILQMSYLLHIVWAEEIGNLSQHLHAWLLKQLSWLWEAYIVILKSSAENCSSLQHIMNHCTIQQYLSISPFINITFELLFINRFHRLIFCKCNKVINVSTIMLNISVNGCYFVAQKSRSYYKCLVFVAGISSSSRHCLKETTTQWRSQGVAREKMPPPPTHHKLVY